MRSKTAPVLTLALLLNFVALDAARANTLTADGTICTLANAIRAANTDAPAGGCPAGAGADVVQLAQDVSLDFADATASGSSTLSGARAGLPDISTPITVQALGSGGVVERDAALGCDPPENGPNNAFRIFNVVGPAAHLTLDGITVQNGCVAPEGTVARGGGILVEGGTLTLSAATLAGNVARAQVDTESPGEGGGVYGDAASHVALLSALFSGNLALGATGATAPPQATLGGAGVGGALLTLGTLTVSSSQFAGNRAQGGDAVGSAGEGTGGAIYLEAGASATVETSVFTANEAAGGPSTGGNAGSGGAGVGGAIAMDGQAALSAIRRSSFLDNRATGGLQGGFGSGGALALSGVVGVLDRLLVRGNAAVGGDGDGAGNSAGGGLAYSGTSFDALRDSWFDANSATGGTGTLLGGDGAGGGASLLRDVGEIRGVTFSGNVARGNAGSQDFSGRGEGGGLYNIFGTIGRLANCTFYGNLAQGGGAPPATGGQASGGAIHNAGDLPEVSHLTILANVASSVGDDAFGGGLHLQLGGTLAIDNSILAGNAVENAGGGSAFDADCHAEGTFTSAGSNHIQNSVPTCTFAAADDVQDVDPLLGPFADHGCVAARTLLDGGCAPTAGLLVTSAVVDRGSCALSGLADDQRGETRPVDIAGLPNAEDACDKGAFELLAAELEVDLSIAKTPPADAPAVGENAAFVLTVANESTLLPATGVVVTDLVPAGLSFAGSDCGATEFGGTVTWNVGGMPPETSLACTLTFLRLDAAAIFNSAEVTGAEPDPDSSNDLATAELTSVLSIVEVPTLDDFGVLLLALGLAAAALLRLRA